MTTRYYAEEPCEHGIVGGHRGWTPPEDGAVFGRFVTDPALDCPGGVRRELTINYRAAAIEWIGEEPPNNYPSEWEQMIQSVIEQTVKPIVDAALKGDHR